MDKIKKILAPTDLSELSQGGVRLALEFGRTVGAKATVYYVASHMELMELWREIGESIDTPYTFHPPHYPLEACERALSRFLKDHFSDLMPGVEVEEKVDVGVADKKIVKLAETEGSDLIVISTHGRTGLSRMLVGSVTEKVVRHAPCPVISTHTKPKDASREKSAVVGQESNTLV